MLPVILLRREASFIKLTDDVTFVKEFLHVCFDAFQLGELFLPRLEHRSSNPCNKLLACDFVELVPFSELHTSDVTSEALVELDGSCLEAAAYLMSQCLFSDSPSYLFVFHTRLLWWSASTEADGVGVQSYVPLDLLLEIVLCGSKVSCQLRKVNDSLPLPFRIQDPVRVHLLLTSFLDVLKQNEVMWFFGFRHFN